MTGSGRTHQPWPARRAGDVHCENPRPSTKARSVERDLAALQFLRDLGAGERADRDVSFIQDGDWAHGILSEFNRVPPACRPGDRGGQSRAS